MTAVPLVTLEALTAREPPYALAPLTAELGPGVHALLGAKEDAVGIVLAAVAGAARARSGRVRVLGGAPADPAVARGVAYVPRQPALVEVLRVGEVLEMAAQVRREPPKDPRARLGALGIADLLARKVNSLSLEEVRAVAIAEALTSLARVILLDEPYTRVEPRAATNLAAAIRGRAADGACILVATASPREATDLAADLLFFHRGVLVRRAPTSAEILARAPGPSRIRVVCKSPRALAAALAGEEAVHALEADPRGVLAQGTDPIAIAKAIARASVGAGVDVESMRAEAPTLEELRASLAGDAQAAFEAARARALGSVATPGATP